MNFRSKKTIVHVALVRLFGIAALFGCQSNYNVAYSIDSDDSVTRDTGDSLSGDTDKDTITDTGTGADTEAETESDAIDDTGFGSEADSDIDTIDDTGSGTADDTGVDTNNDTGVDTDVDTETPSDSDTSSEQAPQSCEETCVFPVADHVDLTYAVWGEEDIHYYVPTPGWAMAAIQASRMLAYYFSGGLTRTVSPNWFLATALKESFLGCCEDIPEDAEHPPTVWQYQAASENDGCFQIEASTAFVEMQRIFPSHFIQATHDAVISGCNLESSALTMAFYDAFVFGMMFNWIDDIDAFFSVTRDPMATETAFSLAYNRGVWSDEFRAATETCADSIDMLECVFGASGTVARDHAYAISRYIQDLDAAALDGRCYNGTITTQDVAAYVEAVAPILAPNDGGDLRARSISAFEDAAKGPSGAFQSTFGAVLEVLESAPLEDPFPKLYEWYGVVGPGGDYVFSWPNIEDTCEIIIPVI